MIHICNIYNIAIKINLPKYKVATIAMAMMYKILYITYNIWLHLAI